MVESSNERVGEYLRKKRQEKGLSLAQLKELTGIDRAHMLRIEQGTKRPTEQLLEKLAPALEVDLDELTALVTPRLPALAPYLRAKYELPDEAVEELERHFAAVTKQYRPKKKRSQS